MHVSKVLRTRLCNVRCMFRLPDWGGTKRTQSTLTQQYGVYYSSACVLQYQNVYTRTAIETMKNGDLTCRLKSKTKKLAAVEIISSF